MRHLSRRQFARHAGIASLFYPFLSLLGSEPVRAQAGPAKYLLLFFTPGTDVTEWSPRGSSENSIVFSRMTEPLSPLASNLVLIEKLSSNGSANSHGSPGGLTGMGHGYPRHISVDQFVSDGLRQAGIRTQIPNLILGGVAAGQSDSFFRDGRGLLPILSPTAAHQVIFGGGGTMPGDDVPSAAADRLRRRQSVLDLMKDELMQLSQTLGAEERAKLSIHSDSIRQLEERLAGQAGDDMDQIVPVDCTPPAVPSEVSEDLLNSSTHLDLAINALACDITRVASVQFGHHQSTQVSLPEVGQPGDWHNSFLHSDQAPRTRLINLERWLAGQFVAAAEKLKALPAPDGSGSLFDQTLLVWARDMGDGVVHDGSDMRFVFSGGAGGYLRTSASGVYIDGGGDAHLRALLNICEAMGITNFNGFGDDNLSGDARTPLTSIVA